jgi:hypothetical protein
MAAGLTDHVWTLREVSQDLPVALSPLVTPSKRAVWTHLAGSGRPLLAAFPHHGWFTPPRAAATVVLETAASRAASRRDPSGQRPWQASVAASARPSLCHASAQPGAEGGVSSRAVSKNYSTRDTVLALVAYPWAADKYLRPLASRLSSVNQPVMLTRNAFSTPRPTPWACL